MKHSLLHIALVSSFIFTDFRAISPISIWNFFFNNHQEELVEKVEEEECPETDSNILLGPAAQEVDSLALIDLRVATSSLLLPWTISWNINDPVCTWFGVTLDSEGYVTKLEPVSYTHLTLPTKA